MALWDLLETIWFHQPPFPLPSPQTDCAKASWLSWPFWLRSQVVCSQYLCTFNSILVSASQRSWTGMEGGVGRTAALGSETLSPSLSSAPSSLHKCRHVAFSLRNSVSSSDEWGFMIHILRCYCENGVKPRLWNAQTPPPFPPLQLTETLAYLNTCERTRHDTEAPHAQHSVLTGAVTSGRFLMGTLERCPPSVNLGPNFSDSWELKPDPAQEALLCESENTHLSSWPRLRAHSLSWGGVRGELVWRKISASYQIRQAPETRATQQGSQNPYRSLGWGRSPPGDVFQLLSTLWHVTWQVTLWASMFKSAAWQISVTAYSLLVSSFYEVLEFDLQLERKVMDNERSQHARFPSSRLVNKGVSGEGGVLFG